MSTDFRFSKNHAIALLLVISPFLLKAQCAPRVQIFDKFMLIFDASATPDDIVKIDLEITDGPNGSGLEVFRISNIWQTFQTFEEAVLNGKVTLHFADESSMECEYINGFYQQPLAAELSAFNVHLMGDDVFLSWSTEYENNNAGFEIERSFDGLLFDRIAFRNGAGNSDEKSWYYFEDENIKNTALKNIVYYRLKQISYDQSHSYSEILDIDLKIDITGFKITKILGRNSPDRIIKVYFHNPPSIRKVNITLATISGQLLEQRSIAPHTGFNFFEIDLSNQKENFYFISLDNGKQKTVEKLIMHHQD